MNTNPRTGLPASGPQMLPIEEVQAYIEVKMARSLSYLVELYSQLRLRLPEDEIEAIVREATARSIPAATSVMKRTAHLFEPYVESGEWPEFMKDESFEIEERDGFVTVVIPNCALNPYMGERFICLNEHEFVKELLHYYRGLNVADEYTAERTYDEEFGRHVCVLRYAVANDHGDAPDSDRPQPNL